jgi:hypothetical protein
MLANGFSPRAVLGLASSAMPMIGMAGGPSVAVMAALFALGCGFDPPTQRMGINSHIAIGPDGKLSAPLWRQADNAAGPAPQGYYDVGNSICSALQQRLDSGQIDPSWMQRGAGLFIEYLPRLAAPSRD